MSANKFINEDDFSRKMLIRMKRLNEEFETAATSETEESTELNKGKSEVKIPQNDPYFAELKNNFNKFVGPVQTDENSLIVYPNDNDVVFNGMLISMNNLKFQFRYNDQSGGLYIWGDSVLLNKENAGKLSKLVVLKDQWETYWGEKLADYQK
jgi:hypothetical protein